MQKKKLDREQILKIAGDYYVGYNPAYTLETALATVGSKFNEHLQTKLSLPDLKTLMEGKNVIQCGGLDNYMVALFYKMEESKNS